jgi:hypothetical protein
MSGQGPELRPAKGARVRKLLGLGTNDGAGVHESSGSRRGPPDEIDRKAIAALIDADRIFRGTEDRSESQGDGAETAATTLVSMAKETIARLDSGVAVDSLSDANLAALEAILFLRGRPALNVEAARIEAIDSVKHPGAARWRTFVEEHEPNLVRATSATGAVVACDHSRASDTWIAGTAWLIKPNLAVTNRHVLFPGPLGVALAERKGGSDTTARIKPTSDIVIDFALDAGGARNMKYTALDVPFVCAPNDPIDLALIRIAPMGPAFRPPSPLVLAASAPPSKYMYVVGHPGLVNAAELTEDIQAVFGRPDGRKRVSLGEFMPPDGAWPNDLIHDASTIGGYSGACVLAFNRCEVAALHYHGTFLDGNRAISADAIRRHEVAAFF